MAYLDPTAIVQAITGGATWRNERLRIAGVDNYCTAGGGAWALTTSPADKIRKADYTQLQGGTVNADLTVTCSAGVFQLASVDGYAHLIDP